MLSSVKVSIVLPVLNEPSLSVLILDLESRLVDVVHEIVVVKSDKVKDRSLVLPPALCLPHVKVFTSYGDSLERAILLGFSVAKGEKIIVMDADGSHPPYLVPTLVKLLDGYDMVVASRFVKFGKYDTTFSRYLTSYLFTKYAQMLGSGLFDPMSGYFGFKASLLNDIRFKPYKWKTALELNNKLRPSTIEVPYTFVNRKVGRSKSSWKIGLRILWDLLEGAL